MGNLNAAFEDNSVPSMHDSDKQIYNYDIYNYAHCASWLLNFTPQPEIEDFCPQTFFFPVNRSSWNLRSHGSIFLYQPFAHTVIFIPVSQVLCLYGTNCLRTFTTVSPFLPLNSLSIMLFDITFFF